jgi:hypothetical protein
MATYESSFTNEKYWQKMKNSRKFRKSFVDGILLESEDYGAIFLEFEEYVPNEPLRYTIVDATTSFSNVKQNSRSFRKYFTDEDAVAFDNLSGDTKLVVPTDQDESTNYAHLLSFLRTASNEQIDSTLQLLATSVLEEVDNRKYYVSTHGLGVHWLHFRICETPKYYSS